MYIINFTIELFEPLSHPKLTSYCLLQFMSVHCCMHKKRVIIFTRLSRVVAWATSVLSSVRIDESLKFFCEPFLFIFVVCISIYYNSTIVVFVMNYEIFCYSTFIFSNWLWERMSKCKDFIMDVFFKNIRSINLIKCTDGLSYRV